MIRVVLVWMVMVAGGIALADPPRLVIPTEIRAMKGDWLVIQPDTDAKAVSYVGLDGLAAFPSSELKDSRKLIVNPSANGRYRFVAVGSLNDVHTRAAFTIVVGDVPNPTPPTPPNPAKPDGVLGVRKASRDGSRDRPAAERAKLAAAQRSVASAIAAGAVGEPSQILSTWRDQNRAAVASPADWAAWGKQVSSRLETLYADGKLPDKSAWAAAFREAAEGLED